MANYDDRLADYIDVAERIRIFRERYPEGSLQPAYPDKPFQIVSVAERTFVLYIAAAYRSPDDPRPGIGMAWEPFPGLTPYSKNSELMVAETGAWGRAIVAALAADSKKVASLDEVRARRTQNAPETRQEPTGATNTPSGRRMASDGQKRLLRTLAKERGYALPDLDELSSKDAYDLTEKLKAMPTGTNAEEPF